MNKIMEWSWFTEPVKVFFLNDDSSSDMHCTKPNNKKVTENDVMNDNKNNNEMK